MRSCPECGEQNAEGARFCSACGSSLSTQAHPSEERKVVTVLFCDLVGFTGRSDQADPEDVRATLRPYHERVRQEIERFGGTVEKFIGDAVMAVFGAPVAHEDDAERAVRAALRILDSVGELNRERPDLDLAIRIGINTGEVVVALAARPERGEGIVTGDVVNTASRLEVAAPVGTAVVGEVTFRATEHQISYEELEPVTPKGKAHPVRLWRAISLRPGAAGPTRPDESPFVGRELDLALLNQTFLRVLRERSLQLVTIVGEPGIGKSRLLAEFRSWVEEHGEPITWHQGRCLSYGDGITFWALGEVVKAEAGILESDGPAEARAKLDRSTDVLGDPAERDWVRARLAPLIGLGLDGQTAEPGESFTAWRRFLEALAVRAPLVVVFEDLHWADPVLLDFLDHLLDWSTGVPIMVVSTARPDLYDSRPGWGGGKRNSSTLGLSPLTEEETARLIHALLSRSLLPADVQGTLLDRAAGNPLYAQEFARMLRDRNLISERGAAMVESEIPVPETVQAVIAARLDTLSQDRKSVLQDAAVLGKEFWSGGVASIGGREESDVLDALHELSKAELIRPAIRATVAGQAEYSFWHILVRDVAYGQIPRAVRAEKHWKAANWIERLAGERVVDQSELLAYHYGQAHELTRAAGLAPEAALIDRLRKARGLAGDRALPIDPLRATTHYRGAIELVEAEEDRVSLLWKLGDALFGAGLNSEAEASYREALGTLDHARHPLFQGPLLRRLARVLRDRGETEDARATLREAVGLLERDPPGEELVWASFEAARDVALRGLEAEAIPALERTILLAQSLEVGGAEGRALQWLGFIRVLRGEFESALEDSAKGLEMCLAVPEMGEPAALAYNNHAALLYQLNRPREAIAVQERGVRFAENRGLTGHATYLKLNRLGTMFDLGEWDEVEREVGRIVDEARERGWGQHEVFALALQAFLWANLGRLDEASRLQERLLSLARKFGDAQVILTSFPVAALMDFLHGRSEAAVVLLEEGIDRSRAGVWVFAMTTVFRLAAAAGRSDLAARVIDLNEQEQPSPLAQNALLAGRAVLAEARGDLDEAIALYSEAERRWNEISYVLEHAQALLGHGRCLLALGRAQESAAVLRQAREAFAQLRAKPWLEEVDALLGKATALTS
jgi:class 3 adenylate cyclase/tetratricopeptide (TPR) repeat protein